MSPQIKAPTRETWRRGGSIETWSQIIRSRNALPLAFETAAGWLVGDESSSPYLIYAPRLAGTRPRTAERLVALVNDAIYIWEHSGRQVELTTYPVDMISAVEVGEILLYSWLKITGLTGEGSAGATTIEFNTVSLEYYWPFINRIRPAAANVSESVLRSEQDKFNYLDSINYKFMNYARASLLPGETVIDHLWQRRIRRPILPILGHTFQRTASVAHVTILTDKELIIISEDERTADIKGGRYGNVRCYVPLGRVAGVFVSPKRQDLVALSFKLSPDDRQIEMCYEAGVVDKVERFRTAVESGVGRHPSEDA